MFVTRNNIRFFIPFSFIFIICVLGENSISKDKVYMKVPFRGYSISVWKENGFFLTLPIGFMSKDSIQYTNTSDQSASRKIELNFNVELINEDFKRSIVNHLRTFTDECVKVDQIGLVQTEKITVILKSRPGKLFNLYKQWNVSTESKQEVLNLKIPCDTDMNVCSLFKKMLQNDPKIEMRIYVFGQSFVHPITVLESKQNQSDPTIKELVECKSKQQIQMEKLVNSVQELAKTNALLFALLKNRLGKCRFEDSIVLNEAATEEMRRKFLEMVQKYTKFSGCWKKCYTASTNDYLSHRFHHLCDFKGPTITLLQVGEYISGGYTDQSWHGKKTDYTYSESSFLFSLNRNHVMPIKPNELEFAIYSSMSNGPSFGSDLRIKDDCHQNTRSSADGLGIDYTLPPGFERGTKNTKRLLTGERGGFSCTEYEVYFQDPGL